MRMSQDMASAMPAPAAAPGTIPRTALFAARFPFLVQGNFDYATLSEGGALMANHILIDLADWLRGHAALRLRAVQIPPRGQDRTWIGRRLQFWGRAADVLTSPVVEVGRPPRLNLDSYISQARSGEILV